MKLYTELADWWPLLSAPEEYAEEAAIYTQLLSGAGNVLELGSGGGSNAFHMKQHFRMTLSDASEDMLRVSRALNPDCEHIAGDMRTLRLHRTFDAVFVHDAIMYLTGEDDLRRAFETAYAHTRPGGIALFVPDCTAESFEPTLETGGRDDGERGLRFLEWSYDPDPNDSRFQSDFAVVLREGGHSRCIHETHHYGLFGEQQWIGWLREAGFEVRRQPDSIAHEVFLATRPR